MRKVVDFRGLNKLCVTDAYPLPLMDQLLDELSASEYMGATDLKSGYWQVPVHEDSCDKLAFITNFGLFQYRRTPTHAIKAIKITNPTMPVFARRSK